MSNESNFNLKIASADVGDALKKRREELVNKKLGPKEPSIMDQLPEVKDDQSSTSEN